MAVESGEVFPVLSRRRFLGGMAAMVTSGLILRGDTFHHQQVVPIASSIEPDTSPLNALPETETTTLRSSSTTTTETVPEPRVELPDLTRFRSGEFLGVAMIHYVDTPDRPTAEVDAYYQREGIEKPPMNNPFVHQLIVGNEEGSGGAITEEMLAHGVVAHKINGPVRILAMHNVTPVDAPIIVDGVAYNQQQMGINAVVVPGDVLTLTLPNQLGQLSQFAYQAVRSWVVDTYDRAATEAMLHDSEPFGVQKIRTYKCWEPGDDRYRLIDEWTEVDSQVSSASVLQGNDGRVGSVGPNL